MKTKIQRWGNSLGLRIPKALAEEAGVQEGSSVDLSLEDDGLVVRPVRHRYDLTSLVEQINDSNVHETVESGPPVGREAW